MIYVILFAIASLADAISTIVLIRAGGVEKWSAWLVGKNPSPIRCVIAFFALPTSVIAYAVWLYPQLWVVAIIGALWRSIAVANNVQVIRDLR